MERSPKREERCPILSDDQRIRQGYGGEILPAPLMGPDFLTAQKRSSREVNSVER